MSFPQPGTLYRIQSIDFDTCLHVWDVRREAAVLRPLKETNLQQWLFIKESGPGERYKIMAAATQSLRSPRYLTLKEAGEASYPRGPAPPSVGAVARASIWEISKENDGSYVLTTAGKEAEHEAFLRVSETGMLDSVEREVSNEPSENCSERWQIIEYWPSIPQDTYRIRTLNGGALEINANLNGLAVGAVRSDYRQEWLVEPKGNGNCVLSLNTNNKEKVFLGWERGKDGFARVATSKTSSEWFIKSVGEYTYSLTFGYSMDSKTTLTLALSIVDEEILVKARKIAHNQIWFLERVNALSSTDAPPPYSPSVRYPEMIEREYAVQNIGTGQYFAIWRDSPPRRAGPYGYKWVFAQIRYVDASNTFRIMAHNSSGERLVLHFSGNATEVVTGSANGTSWVLERVNDPAQGFLYYICVAQDRSQVLSGETTAGPGGNPVFRVTTKVLGSTNQQWKFEI